MGRAGYSDSVENWSLIRWRGQVTSAIRGKRGQAFLLEMVEALDAMPVKRLIANELEVVGNAGNVCALGSVGARRGIDMRELDPDDHEGLAAKFGIAHQLVREIEWENDDGAFWDDTPEKRWKRVRAWAESQLIKEK